MQQARHHGQPRTGLAQARTLVRALRVEMIPAFATLTVCCSITSCSCATHLICNEIIKLLEKNFKSN